MAEAMAACGVRVLGQWVEMWEQGRSVPTEAQLVALADALWCDLSVLIGRSPSTLRELRLNRRLSQEQLSSRIGMALNTYAIQEVQQRWEGSKRQTWALVTILQLSACELVVATGRGPELRERLLSAVQVRLQPQVAPLAELTEIPHHRVNQALHRMADELAALSPAQMVGFVQARVDKVKENEMLRARDRYVEGIVDRFWTLVGPSANTPLVNFVAI
ncbi:transcriptional regulator [Streptomyces sp. NPDC059169]|uniref:transcriptional regulator n=1 Tax=Streptomyces sp. NPDC059169 TaxID=3346754 RepID=UPI00367739C6